jgi:hypothetical protein
VAAVIGGGLHPGLCSILEWCAISTYLAWAAFVSLDTLGRSRAERRGA